MSPVLSSIGPFKGQMCGLTPSNLWGAHSGPSIRRQSFGVESESLDGSSGFYSGCDGAGLFFEFQANLEEAGPEFSGDEEAVVQGVVGDAV